MANPGDAAPYGDDYIVRRLDDLQRQIRELGPSVSASFNSTVARLSTPDWRYYGERNFAVPTGAAHLVAVDITPRQGATSCTFTTIATLNQVHNTTATTEYVRLDVNMAASGTATVAQGLASVTQSVAAGLFVGMATINTGLIQGLTDATIITATAAVSVSSAGFAADPNNLLSVAVIAQFMY